jgi:chemotaxis protein MotB
MSDFEDRFEQDARPADEGGLEETALKESEEVQEREFYGAASEGGENRSSEHLWLISYSDFMTIMMIFYLGMYGYSHLMKMKASEVRVDRFVALASEMKAKMNDQVRVLEEMDKITVELGEGILFSSGHAELTGAAVRTLADIGSTLKEAPGDVIVEGHTDNVPIAGGPYPSNWELSAARAFSVVQELKKAGVPAERLAAWGFGENRPVVDNATPENRQRNRRIDIVIMKKKLQNA